jgi:membrane-bound lytic murein transglycosylase D
MNLIITCLLAACQSLPNLEESTAPDESSIAARSSKLLAEPHVIANTPELPHEEILKTHEPLADGLWNRMRKGYRLEIPNNSRISQLYDWYLARPSHIQHIHERATPFLYFIMEEIERRDIPAEIALLPAVESGYRPFAYSPGRASGLWQFIPSTGKQYGLKQNWWYDGRRDAIASTQAALDYLKALNKQFNGDWELALAAYNSGAGTVRGAILQNKKRGKATDYWSLKLPDETMNYVPRLLALAKIFENTEILSGEHYNIPNEPYFTAVDISSQLDLALAAEMAEISIEELYLLNAGFNRWATDPEGPHRLALPVDKEKTFLDKLAALPSEKRLTWMRYKIKKGDTLSLIAHRYSSSSQLIKKVNNLKNNTIHINKHLLVPVSNKSLEHYVYAQNQRKSAVQNRSRKGRKIQHHVKSGESLWTIARAHQVNYKKLASWNSMAPGDPLIVGQKLVIWVSTQNQVTLLDRQAAATQSRLRYKVKRGDSLSRIAQRFNVSVSDLKRWNTLDGKYIQPGQHLKLYVNVTEQTL